MAGIKKYDIAGVADVVQLGKHGPHIAAAADGIELRDKDGALVKAQAAPGTDANDLVTVSQLKDQSAQITALQAMLAKLMPSAPPSFPSQALTIKGAKAFLAAGDVPNASASGLTAGTAVTRVSGSVVSNEFKTNGPGDKGTLTLSVDGQQVDVHDFTQTNAVDSSGLVVSNVTAYPADTPGFWTSFDARLNIKNVATGAHSIAMTHSLGGTAGPVIVVVDDLAEAPTLSNGALKEASSGTPTFSSSVPHYGAGASLDVSVSMANICGEAYYGGDDPLVISAMPDVMTKQAFSYSSLGVSLPIQRQTFAAVSLQPVTVNVDMPNFHGLCQIEAKGSNVVGSTTYSVAATKLLIKQGTTSHIDEQNVPVQIRAGSHAVRVTFETESDTPAGAASAFVSNAALRSADATVVAGVLAHDETNYSTGYLPVGPDLSQNRSGAQYATFAFSLAALSKFSIAVQGTYDHCWVKLPGVAEDPATSPVSAAVNGWWDAYQSYNGAGAPGGQGDTANGCAAGQPMTGKSGTFGMTFGTETSSNSTGQTILVRFRLMPGQSITNLAFTA